MLLCLEEQDVLDPSVESRGQVRPPSSGPPVSLRSTRESSEVRPGLRSEVGSLYDGRPLQTVPVWYVVRYRRSPPTSSRTETGQTSRAKDRINLSYLLSRPIYGPPLVPTSPPPSSTSPLSSLPPPPPRPLPGRPAVLKSTVGMMRKSARRERLSLGFTNPSLLRDKGSLPPDVPVWHPSPGSED